MPMKPVFTALLILAVLLGTGGSLAAHEGGHVTLEQDAAVRKGEEVVELLVRRGKLHGSWSGAALDAAELKVTGPRQWHLTFRNDAAPAPEQRRLFIFLTADGQLLGANFKGEAR